MFLIPSIVLFMVAFVAGCCIERRRDFWLLAGLLLLIFGAFIIMWHDAHGWPGFLVPAFASQLGNWILSIFLGTMLGGLIFGGVLKKKVI